MISQHSFQLWFLAIILTTGYALIHAIGQGQISRITLKRFAIISMPGTLTLISFYLAAAKMYLDLNGWPDNIGYSQVPESTLPYITVATWAFSITGMSIACAPIALAIFLIAPRLRQHLIYPSLFVIISFLALLLTLLAPSGFLNWWWD